MYYKDSQFLTQVLWHISDIFPVICSLFSFSSYELRSLHWMSGQGLINGQLVILIKRIQLNLCNSYAFHHFALVMQQDPQFRGVQGGPE